MGPEIVLVAIIAYIGFMQWLQHQRRAMMHRERLAAIEKGASLPADAEPQRGWLAALAWPPRGRHAPRRSGAGGGTCSGCCCWPGSCGSRSASASSS